eukprot:scaffold106854_cov72-Phaeocystis_antarctica.AAC.3
MHTRVVAPRVGHPRSRQALPQAPAAAQALLTPRPAPARCAHTDCRRDATCCVAQSFSDLQRSARSPDAYASRAVQGGSRGL